jgi:hypothetical protein
MEPDSLDQSLGGGEPVEESGITLPSAAAEEPVKDRTHISMGMQKFSIPIKGQDGLPCNKSGITNGIMDGFAQPLPNLDHIIDRRVPPPLVAAVAWKEVREMSYEVSGDSDLLAITADDDLDDVPLGQACNLDGDSCESCQ